MMKLRVMLLLSFSLAAFSQTKPSVLEKGSWLQFMPAQNLAGVDQNLGQFGMFMQFFQGLNQTWAMTFESKKALYPTAGLWAVTVVLVGDEEEPTAKTDPAKTLPDRWAEVYLTAIRPDGPTVRISRTLLALDSNLGGEVQKVGTTIFNIVTKKKETATKSVAKVQWQ